jgi:hypothetical protein
MSAFDDLIKAAQKPFSAVKVVKEMSRKRFQNMPGEKRIDNKKVKRPKYKPDYSKDY